jgi:hypothetical protein
MPRANHEHWSFSYERCLGSACVGVPMARLQAVAAAVAVFFVMMWYNQYEATSVDKCFSFNLLLFLISVSSSLLPQSILPTLMLLTQTDLLPSPRKIHQVIGNTFHYFTQQ